MPPTDAAATTTVAWRNQNERSGASNQADLQTLGMRIEPFLPVDGERAGRLWPLTRRQGLSLGDRACLSLGLRLGLTVVTCDRAWAQLPIELEIQLLR